MRGRHETTPRVTTCASAPVRFVFAAFIIKVNTPSHQLNAGFIGQSEYNRENHLAERQRAADVFLRNGRGRGPPPDLRNRQQQHDSRQLSRRHPSEHAKVPRMRNRVFLYTYGARPRRARAQWSFAFCRAPRATNTAISLVDNSQWIYSLF